MHTKGLCKVSAVHIVYIVQWIVGFKALAHTNICFFVRIVSNIKFLSVNFPLNTPINIQKFASLTFIDKD